MCNAAATDPGLRAALAALEASGLAHNTRRGYAHALRAFWTWRGRRSLSPEVLQAYAEYLLEDEELAPATVNHRLAAVRWWARQLAQRPEEPAASALQAARAARVGDVPASPSPAPPPVSEAALEALLAACLTEPGPAGVRDAALVAVAFAVGLRRAELCRLTLGDLEPVAQGYALRIGGAEGPGARRVTVTGGAAAYIRDWLTVRRAQAPSAEDPTRPLFLAVRRGGQVLDRGLGPQAAYERLKKRAAQAGLPELTWEDARRTVATRLLATGADLGAVQQLLGHSSPATTSAYRLRDDSRPNAPPSLSLPYLGQGPTAEDAERVD